MGGLDRLLAWWGRSPAAASSFPPGHVSPKAMPAPAPSKWTPPLPIGTAPAAQHSVLDGMYLGAMHIGADEVEMLLNDGRRLRITRADVPMVQAALQSLDRTASGFEAPCSDRASAGADESESSAPLRQEPGNRS